MIQTKTIAAILVIGIATVGAIGIQSAQAQRFGFNPGQNDNNQGNNNNQGSFTRCFGGNLGVCGENPQGNQP